MLRASFDAATLQALGAAYLEKSASNRVARDSALNPESAGMRLCEAPIVAVASADDPLFQELKQPGVIGSHFMEPALWQPGARSVISFFLPFTEQIILSNRADPGWPSPQWLHARIEGQAMVAETAGYLMDLLIQAGYPSVVPVSDQRFWRHSSPEHIQEDGEKFLGFTTNWSERHVGYVAGLGTFGLSAGLITARGMAGRIGSVVTTLKLEPTSRPYSRRDEYCTQCGACIARCPVSAISEGGKDHVPCGALIDKTRRDCYPRFGCGKCQVAVPCEHEIPARRP
ncbi:MAG: 4Fe-4S binding protein [Candidatus Adiutrix sp.]|jgi:epoxyqueuosine reductase QueG|nr:4Fe-4S binding protein [Candidatus Adiutrix sp.]